MIAGWREYKVDTYIISFFIFLGILMWEVFSGGKTPYATMTNVDVVEQVTRKGYRMERPEQCPDEIYRIMMKCWRDVSNRKYLKAGS